MSMWVSYWPRWLNQLLSMTKMPPAMTGVLPRGAESVTERRFHCSQSQRMSKPQKGQILLTMTRSGMKSIPLALWRKRDDDDERRRQT
ncbi:hypothetical protein EYF80_048545 [Liparis tanakae]|uniref:Uncharacterized protein n=1 Tax=Liparis tanakae TaxID=230148 RepID=A0A4Z2FK64_9TELE|nr:hypothetical protein EYF80_048545 [Liparis tanakae]